jgi:hypothetical protein
MSIYNLQYLQEMKTKEEYRRESFKKKYNYKPSKDNKDEGEITVDGKKYKVDMGKSKTISVGNDIAPRATSSDLIYAGNKVYLDNNFFKLKGSKKNQRRDAILQHEIGHSRLHGVKADPDKKSTKVFKNTITKNTEDVWGQGAISNMSKNERKRFYEDQANIKDYVKDMDKSKIKDREKAYNTAKKYEKNSEHANASEFEADRYAANRTSASAMKKGLRNYYKVNNKDIKKEIKATQLNDIKDYISDLKNDSNPDIQKYGNHMDQEFKNVKNQKSFEKKMQALANNKITTDIKQRSKALKDKDMQNIKLYKK